MFPYKDDNPTVLTPVVTLVIIGVTSLIWLVFQGGGAERPENPDPLLPAA